MLGTVITRELKVDSKKLSFWNKVLSVEEGCYPDAGRNEVIETLTVDFGNDFQADLKLCNGNTPYIDNVLFKQGSEVDVPEISESLLGEYHFSYEGTDYIVNVVPEVLKDSINIGDYIGVNIDEGYTIGVVSKKRSEAFDLYGFILSPTYSNNANPTLRNMTIKYKDVHERKDPTHPLHSYIAEEFKHSDWKRSQENQANENGLTEEQLINILEGKGYHFFEGGYFDKNLFLTIAGDHYELLSNGLWYERQEDENVYLCNECDDLHEDETTECERESCKGSIRVVHKGDMGL